VRKVLLVGPGELGSLLRGLPAVLEARVTPKQIRDRANLPWDLPEYLPVLEGEESPPLGYVRYPIAIVDGRVCWIRR
jgi:hypothetical protein